MYKLFLAILFTLLIGVSSGATKRASQPVQEWERFRAVTDEFSVLFPEWPSVVSRGQFRSSLRIGRDYVPYMMRNYAAYSDGAVYFVISFENPGREKPLDYFLDTQLRPRELRDTEISEGTEISSGNSKGKQYLLKKSDFRKSFSLPGVLRLYETKHRTLALVAVGKEESDSSIKKFLDSFEISEKPEGKDIGAGVTYPDAAVSGDTPVPSSQVSRKVLIMMKPEPQYTEEERRKRLKGGVTLRAVLAASGRVTDLRVVSGIPELAQSAIEVAHKIYFIPAVKDGRFISTSVELEYRFDIY